MITRYTRSEMAAVWNENKKYLRWLQVQLAVCDQLAKAKRIPREANKTLQSRGSRLISKGIMPVARIEALEAELKHDVIAFTTVMAEVLGSTARFLHFGLTSSDVVDTALSMQIVEAGNLVLSDMENLAAVLKRRAGELASVPTIGRSHGIFAEPTSFGLKFLGFYEETIRNQRRMEQALQGIRFGKLSGAVGVCAHWPPEFENQVLKRLGLEREPVSTQVIPRDRHAAVLMSLALGMTGVERIAVELRHLQRSEVGELREGFSKGQKGSSAMPHKRNPISSENITGCARLMRSYAAAAIENIALWHERDISHSSVERVAFPDAFILFDYAVSRMTRVLEQLEVCRPKIDANLKLAGEEVFSGHVLLALVERGARREEAYRWVQSCAHLSLDGKGKFIEHLKAHPQISRLISQTEIERLISTKHQLRNVPKIFKHCRVKV